MAQAVPACCPDQKYFSPETQRFLFDIPSIKRFPNKGYSQFFDMELTQEDGKESGHAVKTL